MSDLATGSSFWQQLGEFEFMEEQGRGEHPSRAVVERWLRHAYGERRFSLLDCGVLSGVTYADLRRGGLEVDYTGIDVSTSVVEDCRRRHPEAAWEQMSATDLRYPDGSFDVVHCRHVLEHLPYYETAVRELARVTSRHLVLCLFVLPAEREELRRITSPGGYVWVNQYARGPFLDLLGRLFREVTEVHVDHPPEPNQVFFCSK